MAKQLNVNLNVNANTSDAKRNLADLSATLNKISTSTTLKINDQSLKEAKQAAIDLQQHLNKAINVDTGKLDLNKFSQSLSKAGQDLSSLHNKLAKIGPDGQQAFLKLAQSISQADSSALTLGSKLSQLGTTLKNTARWQISSSILHGFMGALQGAYGYAQDLNKSLNNIRIVTGYSTDQMAAFAEQANRAAKALSTSTTAYTDAALIYYQQGLTGKAVTERTETTVKLANVSRQSAEEVSSQMTAIWNNFYDGSKSLEYYADVITKLGAATASSSDEIAQGLQKFAAVADTVGLSYEKATAALATVVAETRQSADVVGTAFKTMFARFQGVSLGETLEDGVGLNKYSAALKTVGVDILEANGNLKDMDTILDELGEKWNQIGNAQQVALAETVAGTRQYAQFMAIMENYDKILANQQLGAGAEGTLQKQADIYAESWEAASKRVRAAAQGIYQDLLDDKFFITALNGLEKFLTGINNVIDGMGGLKGILLLISSIIMQRYAKEIPNVISNLASNISILTGVAEKRKQQQLQQLNVELQSMNVNTRKNQAFTAEQQMIQTTAKMTMDLNEKRKQLSATEIAAYETKIRLVEAYGKNTIAIGQEIEALNKEASASARTVQAQLQRAGHWGTTKRDLAEAEKRTRDLEKFKSTSPQKAGKGFMSEAQRAEYIRNEQLAVDQLKGGKNLLKELQQQTEAYGKMSFAVESVKKASQGFQEELNEATGNSEKMQQLQNRIQGCADELQKANLNTKDLMDALSKGDLQTAINLFENLEDDSNKVGESFTNAEERILQILDALKALGADSKEVEKLRIAVQNGTISQEEFNARIKEMQAELDNTISHTMAFSEALGSMAGFMSQVAMTANALKNIGNIWSNDNLTDGEKMLQTITSLSMVLPTLITLLNKERVSQLGGAAARILGLKATVMQTTAEGKSIPVKIASGEAGWIALGPLLLFVGIAAGAIALIYALSKAIETPAEKLKRLKKEQEELNELTEKANEEWKEFTDTLSNYDVALKGLSELTKGTEAFNEKLKEANDLAKELITKLSLNFLEDYFYDSGTGAIIFTKSGKDKISQASKQIESGQRALAWAGYEKDRQVAAQQRIIDSDKNKKAKYDYVKQRFGVAYGDNTNWTGVEDNLIRYFTGDKNGQIDLNAVNANQIAEYLKESFRGTGKIQDDQTALNFADYIIESLKEQNRAGAFKVSDYANEQNDIVEFLGAENPYANLIAAQLFSSEEEIKQRAEDVKNKLTPEVIDDLWDSTYGMLTDDEQKELLKKYNNDKAAAILPGKLAETYENLATEISDSVNSEVGQFSDKNKEVLTKLLLGQTQQLSPEQIQQRLAFAPGEEQAFNNAYQLLYGTSANVNTLWRNAQGSYSEATFNKSQIEGLDIVQSKLKELNKAFGSLKFGDIIESLEGLSEEAASYFTMMEDGTYKLTGSVEQFQAALFRQKSAKFENEITGYNTLSKSAVQVWDDSGDDLVGERERGLTPEESTARQNAIISYALLSDNLQQLNTIQEKFNELGIEEELQTVAVNTALQDLATKYETCTDELNDFQTALQSNNSELIAAAGEALRYSITTAELAEQMDLSVDDIEDQTRAFIEEENSLDKYIDTEKEQLKVATKMAVLNQSMNKGVTTLSKNWNDWKKILDKSEKTSMDYIDTIQEMRSVLKDLAGITDDNFIPDDFFDVQSNLDLMEEAAKGDVKAINLLGTSLAKAAVEGKSFAEGMQVGFSGLSAGTDAVQMMANSDMMNLLDSAEERFNYYRDNVLSGIDSLTQKISDGVAEAGMDLSQLLSQDAETWAQSLNELAIATGMTVSEMTSMLNSLGIEAEVVSEIKPVHQKVPQYHTITEEAEDSTPERLHTITSTWQDGYYEVDGEMEVAQINMGKNNLGKKPTIRYAGRSTPAPSSITTDAGKGGSSSKAAQKTTQKEYKNVTEESERYHVLTKQLEDLSKSYEKASKQKDRLFGKNRLQAIKDEMSALQALIKHNQAYLSAIGVYLGQDKDKLIKGGLTKDWVDSQGNLQHFTSNAVGIDLRFDENGNVVNYDEYIEHIVAAYNAAVDKYNQDIKQEGLEDDAKEVIEDTFKQAEMQYELALEALKQYEDINEKFQEKLEEIRDSAREAQDKRLEEWSYQLELRIKVNDEDKRYLEYFRKSLQRFAKDAFAPVTELLSYWNSNGGDSDWKLMKISADTIKSATEDLLNASHGDPVIDPNTGEILQDFEYSQADWMSSLDECEDKIYEQIDAIYELDDTMSHYYADTLSEAETQLDQYMTKMEDCTAVLKHFQAISDLLGKETNYEWIEQILAAERETIQNELESATKEYELAKQQYDTMLARYEADKNSVDEGTRQLMEQELQAQYESMSKWQEKMLSKTEEYAELLNSIYENAIKKIGKAFEDAATKDLGWESLLNSMDRVAAYQDLILTRTNQVYETNKLMNQLSQDIDKTTNTAAKTKLNNFKQEIQDMQNLNVMSKFDLDVAKARYEILKAQIALEDAQNAKSTVRLQRDNEGNYGYVYTADQNDIDNAKQALEDKQNDLYNLTLEKANENAKALAQLDQEMYAELERISLLYKDDEEKMLQERQRIIEEYSQRRSVLVKDYATADYWQQQVSVTQTNEAYGDFYKQNLLDTDEWRAEVSTMVESIDTAYDSWTNDMDTYVRPTVGQNLEELQAKTEDLTAASENFQAWFDDFAATNAQRLDAIAAITHEYFLQRQEVEALIADLQRMAEAINNARAQEAGVERGVNNTTQSDITWDPNTDYSALMADYLKNGSSQEDQQYQTWKAQREAKISGMNLQENYYGSRGSQFDENVQIYADNNLTGTIQDAVDALKENTEAVEQSDLSNLSSYASGGYTGAWGSSGKLALLHEKELVLNAADTENILSAVGLIREFNSAIDMRAAASSAMSALNPGSYEAGMQTIQQEVTIHAEFPNATNHNEIEEAFHNLVNRASQYVNRY